MGLIASGQLKTVKGANTSPHRITTSEYVRLGFIESKDELL
jgi:hypothetical protein